MRYLSTRGHADRKRFVKSCLKAWHQTAVLYLPESYPQLDAAA
jgi:threonine synthase